MTDYIYPAKFHLNHDDGSYTVTFPDLPGCITEGKTIGNALYMAQDALRVWLQYTLDEKEPVPEPSDIKQIKEDPDEFVNYVRASVRDNRAVRRTVSIPKWMDEQVSSAGISLSRVLQDALKERLGVR